MTSNYAFCPPIRQNIDYVFIFNVNDNNKRTYVHYANILIYPECIAINNTPTSDKFEDIVALALAEAGEHQPFIIYDPYCSDIAKTQYILRCGEKSRIISNELFNIVNL